MMKKKQQKFEKKRQENAKKNIQNNCVRDKIINVYFK